MSKRLRDIPTSCPMFDKAIAELNYIEGLVESEVWQNIKSTVNAAIDYIEDGRKVNGDLRDTCDDIAKELKKEISDLEDEINILRKEHELEVEELEEKYKSEIYDLQEAMDLFQTG